MRSFRGAVVSLLAGGFALTLTPPELSLESLGSRVWEGSRVSSPLRGLKGRGLWAFSVGFSVGCVGRVQAVLGDSLKKHGTWTFKGLHAWDIQHGEDNAATRLLIACAAVQDCVGIYNETLHYEERSRLRD